MIPERNSDIKLVDGGRILVETVSTGKVYDKGFCLEYFSDRATETLKLSAFICKSVAPVISYQREDENGKGKSSVYRFGEISPLRQKFKTIWQYLEGLFGIWHNFVSTLANFVCFGLIFIVVINNQIMKNKLAIW